MSNAYIDFLNNVNLIPVNVHYRNRLIRFLTHLKEIDEGKIRHHIVPVSWGGKYDKDNLVRVNARQHYVIHHLMWKAFPHDCSMMIGFYSFGGEKLFHLTFKARKSLKQALKKTRFWNNRNQEKYKTTNLGQKFRELNYNPS